VADVVPAATYRRCFLNQKDGGAVLDDLVRLFGRPPFVQGQPDTTAFNCGAKAVIEHIWSQIESARD
jgi:hypothetical protein